MQIMKAFFRQRLSITNFVLFSLLLILLIILFRKIAVFFLITLIVSIFTYLNYYIRLPFDVSPVLFMSLIVSRQYSLWLAFVFIIASGIVPMMMAGGSFDFTTLFYLSLIVFISYLSSLLKIYPFLLVAIPLILAHHIIAAVGSIGFGINPQKEVINLMTKVTVDLLYILGFSSFFLRILG
jgi:hypothetical protein